MKSSFLIAAIAFILISTPALAVTFDASIYPLTINAVSENNLVNFTIDNTGAAGIVQVNITLPSGFSYYGSPGTDVSDTIVLYTPPESGPRWYNRTTQSVINAGESSSFWFKVVTGSARDYEFKISVADTSNEITSKNVTVTATDQTAPTWSQNLTSPSSPATYAPGNDYIFNVTWYENDGMESVYFEWSENFNFTNATTPAVNNLGSGKYSILLSDLSAGNYTYRWYAYDASGHGNSTALVNYNITASPNPIKMYLNGNENQSITINQGEQINVTVVGGAVELYRNETRVSNPYLDILPIGQYIFKANSTGNSNYTSSAGSSYTLKVSYPAPKYSISSYIPTTWHLNSYATWNVSWSDSNDANGFSVSVIELNYSGSVANYTMARLSGTNTATYELNLSAPMTITWRIYGNNSYNVWNSTSINTVTAGKITPQITLTSNPSWLVARGTQTSVFCDADGVSVVLYREGLQVSNPDIQTLGSGSYFYWCNSSSSTNYTSASASSILKVLRYYGDVSFSSANSTVSVYQGSNASAVVVVENTGNASQTVNFTIEGIDNNWYSLNASEASTGIGQKASFLVNFTIGESVDFGEYHGMFKASGTNSTATRNFTLRILPTGISENAIANDLAIYKANMTKVWSQINATKGVVDYTAAELIIIDAKEMIELAESYIENGDYFSAYLLFDEISSLISDSESALSAAMQSAGVTAETLEPMPMWLIATIAVIVISLVGFLIYLLWPQPGYNPKTGKYKPSNQKSVASMIKGKIPNPRRGNIIEISELKFNAKSSYAPKTSIIEKIKSGIKHLFKKKNKGGDYISLSEADVAGAQ